jgi:hypothetical protein
MASRLTSREELRGTDSETDKPLFVRLVRSVRPHWAVLTPA